MAKKFQDGFYWRNNGAGKELAYLKKSGWGYYDLITLKACPVSMQKSMLEQEGLEPIPVNSKKDLISLINEIKGLKT